MNPNDSNPRTVLFADISGSTRLFEQLGNQEALAVVSACMNLLGRVTREHQGTVIKTIGDEIMCAFGLPEQAAAAAVAMQEVVAEDSGMIARQIRLRIGIHHGLVIERGGDLFGDGVNVAARMVAQAKAGQIITDTATLTQIAPERISTRLVDQTRVRGKETVFELFEITWGEIDDLTLVGDPVGRISPTPAGTCLAMHCYYRDQAIRIDRREPVLTIGRDAVNRLMINAPMVSRLHARIELRRQKFILVDQSINGTFIYPCNTEMVAVHRSELILPDSGFIVAGQHMGPDSPLAIRFQCS